MHQGAAARHLASSAIELALVLEDALANGSDRIADYMVRAPVVAERWQPLRTVRYQMLSNSFSFLPLLTVEEGWRLVSDLSVARVVRQAGNKEDRAARLSASIDEAVHKFGLKLDVPLVVDSTASVAEVLERQTSSVPVLVVSGAGNFIGLATPYDFL